MKHFFILILFFQIKFIISKENLNLNFVNLNENNRAISIIGNNVQNGYIFKIIEQFTEKNAVSSAVYLEQINKTGWGHIYVKSSLDFSDELQAYYSGVVEGVISRPLIGAHWSNTYQGYCSTPSDYCSKLSKYLTQNFLSLVYKTRNSSGFLKMVRLQLWQIKGIQDGYDGKWKSNSSDIDENYLLKMQNQLFELYLLQADGDLSALSSILGGENYHYLFTGKAPMSDGKCSAFIKYVKGKILSSHVTWGGYNSMLKMTKMYDFPYRINGNKKSSSVIPGRKLSFSSYPAQTSSVDDFYITSGGLVTIETTIGNNNASLWKPLKSMASEIILEYFRVQAANRLAITGEQWSKLFATNNSGTYNNQWMIVNHNVMKDHLYGDRIPDGVLYIAEQIPSLVTYEDVTDFLRTSYWPSYNLPYNKTIWKLGNFQGNVDKYGDYFDYNKSPRAQIFKRNASAVVDELSLMRLMRFNNFKHDPLAKCPCDPPYSGHNGISARDDLNPQNGTFSMPLFGYRLHGGIDMKITSSSMVPYMRFIGISGPTYDQQPVFDWNNVKDHSVKHNMQPQQFRFPPIFSPFS